MTLQCGAGLRCVSLLALGLTMVACSRRSGAGAGTVSVTEHRVGPFIIDSTVGALLKASPNAERTTVPGEFKEYPALRLSLPGAEILVQQFGETLNTSRPGDSWHVSGANILLPDNLTIRSTWGDFRRAYGRGAGSIGENIDEASYVFCKLPHFIFKVPTAGADSTADLRNPASIPDSTHLVEFSILRTVWRLAADTCDSIKAP